MYSRIFVGLLVSAFLVVCAVVVFWGAIGFGLINLDDYAYLCQEQIVGGLSVQNLRWAFASYEEAIWMPLTWISYQLDYSISNGKCLHFHSIILHGINTILVWIFLRQLFANVAKRKLAEIIIILCALLWSIHPLRVESVVWLSSRKDLVSFFGLISSLNLWITWLKSKQGMRSPFYIASFLLFAMGGLAKSSVMTLPFLMLILDWCLFSRKCLKTRWMSYVPFLVLAICIALEGAIVQRAGGGMDDVDEVALWWRLINASTSYGIYLIHTLLPLNLAAQCTMRYPGIPRLFLPATIITASCVWYLWSNRFRLTGHIIAGLAWYSIAVGPMLGIAAFGYHAFADRFTYIPSVGLSVILCGVLLQVLSERQTIGKLGILIFLAIISIFSWLTIRQVGFWENDGKLFARTLEVDGESNAPAKMSLGWYLYEFHHDVKTAAKLWQDAYALNPGMILAKGQYYMFILCEAGLTDEALAFKRAMSEWNDAFYSRQNDPNIPVKMSWHYSLARLALLIEDAKFRKVAKEEIDEYLAKNTKNIRDWIYLRGRAELLDGNESEAKRIWSTMPNSDCMTEGRYMIYRFTGNH